MLGQLRGLGGGRQVPRKVFAEGSMMAMGKETEPGPFLVIAWASEVTGPESWARLR